MYCTWCIQSINNTSEWFMAFTLKKQGKEQCTKISKMQNLEANGLCQMVTPHLRYFSWIMGCKTSWAYLKNVVGAVGGLLGLNDNGLNELWIGKRFKLHSHHTRIEQIYSLRSEKFVAVRNQFWRQFGNRFWKY